MQPNRPAGWLNTNDTRRVEQLTQQVTTIWKGSVDPQTYTPHDPSHFGRVEQNFWLLIPAKKQVLLKDEERFLLSCAAWTHDIAMNPYAQESGRDRSADDIRRRHVQESAAWVLRERRKFELSFTEAATLSEINLYHSRSFPIDHCSGTRTCNGTTVRPRLLAAYLRLADAMEVGHERVDDWELHRFLFLQDALYRDIDTTLFHWIKSFVVAGIRPDLSSRRIFVEFQAPAREFEEQLPKADRRLFSELAVESARKNTGFALLMRFILEELREELESVENVLALGGITSFHFVEAAEKVALFGGSVEPTWSSGLKRVINYLRVSYSPNSTGTAIAALSAIEDAIHAIVDCACKRAFGPNHHAASSHESNSSETSSRQNIVDQKVTFSINQDDAANVITQLRKNLQNQRNARPCHVELSRITDYVVALATAMIPRFPLPDCKPYILALDNYRLDMHSLLRRDGVEMGSLSENFNQFCLDSKIGHEQQITVFLFGNSATVAQVLVRFAVHRGFDLYCYIAEGRPKTQHGARNVPTYLDAEEYARAIRKAHDDLRKSGDSNNEIKVQIQIVPDISVGTVLDGNHAAGRDKDRYPKVDVLLFGTNGIFLTGDNIVMAHSSGHLALAATAKQLKVPVLVLCLTVKIQENVEGGWQKSERDSNGEWLGSKGNRVFQRLKQLEAHATWNPREDHVSYQLLDAIITEKGVCATHDNPAVTSALLRQWVREIDERLSKHHPLLERKPDNSIVIE